MEKEPPNGKNGELLLRKASPSPPPGSARVAPTPAPHPVSKDLVLVPAEWLHQGEVSLNEKGLDTPQFPPGGLCTFPGHDIPPYPGWSPPGSFSHAPRVPLDKELPTSPNPPPSPVSTRSALQESFLPTALISAAL